MRLVGERKALDLNGPTTCRVIEPDRYEEVVAKLGPDPLAGGRKADVWENIRSSKKPIGALVLDQGVVSGVGNIFRAELFFELEMNPTMRGDEIAKPEFDRLWKSLTKMMRTGLRLGKIVTVTSKEAKAPLASLEGGDRFRIYGKDECPTCLGRIETINVASRKLYWCPACQDGH